MSTPSARTGGSLDAWFKISLRGSTVRQEVVAGLTTFLAMVYSVIVVPGMLGKAGFPPAAGNWLRHFSDRIYRIQPGAGPTY